MRAETRMLVSRTTRIETPSGAETRCQDCLKSYRVRRPGFGEPAGRSSGTSGSGFLCPSLGVAFGTHLTHGFVNNALQFVRVGIGVAFVDVLHGAMKHAPSDGLLDEFRKVTLLCTPRAKKGA